MKFSLVLVLLLLAVLQLGLEGVTSSGVLLDQQRPNLLFIVEETARNHDFEMFGGIPGTTPNFLRLFSRPGSILLDHAYAAYPLCNPSRTSILLGREPDETGVKTNYQDWNDHPNASSWRSLPRFLRENGYYTMMGGKVFHRGTNDVLAWNKTYYKGEDIDEMECSKDRKAKKIVGHGNTKLPFSIGCKTKSESVRDLILAQKTVEQLTLYSKQVNSIKQPFGLFVGFTLPHLPLHVNERFFVNRATVRSRVPVYEPPRVASDFQTTYSLLALKHTLSHSATMGVVRPQIPDSINARDACSRGPVPFRRIARPCCTFTCQVFAKRMRGWD